VSVATTTTEETKSALPQSSCVATYVIVGPESSGKRTLAKLLEFSERYDFSTLSDTRKHYVRLCVQVTAIETLLQATHGQRHTPKEVESEIKRILDQSNGVNGLLSNPELEESLLKAAAEFAKDPIVKKICARPGNIVNFDKSKAFFLKAEDIFSADYEPSKLDIINAREPISALQDPQDVTVRVNESEHDTFRITTVPASWWNAAIRGGNERTKSLDSLCFDKRPFSVVMVIPIDDYSLDENGHGTSLEDDARRKHHEKKKKFKAMKMSDQSGSGSGEPSPEETRVQRSPEETRVQRSPEETRVQRSPGETRAQRSPELGQRPHLSYVKPVLPGPRPPLSPAGSSSSPMSSESSRSPSPYSGSPSSVLATPQEPLQSPAPLSSIVPSTSFPDTLCVPVTPVADTLVTSNAPSGMSALLNRRQKSTTDLMAGKPRIAGRGRRSFMLSVDTTPMDARAQAVRIDECETPVTCTAALPSFPPVHESPIPPLMIPPDMKGDNAQNVTDMMNAMSLDDKTKRQKKKRSRPCVNKVTNGLKVVKRLAGQRIVQDAERIFIVFTRTDRFAEACPQIASINCCFPDYVPAKEEDSKSSADYIVALFDAALREIPAAKKQLICCSLVDEAQVNTTLLPPLLNVAKSAAEERRIIRVRKQEEARLRKEKQALGCVSAPETKEKMHLHLTCGHASEKGRRKRNEDRHCFDDDFRDEAFCTSDRLAYYAIYDGHNGTTVAQNCSEIVHTQLLFHQEFPARPELFFKEGYAHADKLVTVADDKSGATAVTAIIFGNTLYVANIGDSECVLVSRNDEDGSYSNTLMTVKHVLTDDSEKQRVTGMGGMVVCGRLFGTLAVSRAFGDSEFKEAGNEYVSVDPHIATRELNHSDEMMIIACDGLWDRLSYDDAMKQAVELRSSGMGPSDVAKSLIKNALERGTMDNVTVLVVYFDWS